MKKVKYASLLFCLIVKSIGQPVSLHPESQDLFETKKFRVRRQAGYVYDKPSVSFDLPTRATTVSTQAPTVDRIQAQMMYYAYPVPAAGSNAINNSGSSGAKTTATSSTGTPSGSYSYAAPNGASAGAQSTSATGSSQSNRGSSGYGYSAPSAGTGPVSTGSGQSPNGGTSGYGYNAPSVGTNTATNSYQTSSGVGSAQALNTGSSQTAVGSSSGYGYNAPSSAPSGPGAVPTIDVSTNAPKYLPPSSDSGNSNGISSVSNGSPSSGAVSSGPAGAQPLDQYLPPISQPNLSASPLDQYLPPNNQLNASPSLASSGPLVNMRGQSSTGSGPSSTYIQPNNAPAPVIPVTNATPRPFSLVVPPTGYLPPNGNSQTSGRNSLSTPAPTYLPPVL